MARIWDTKYYFFNFLILIFLHPVFDSNLQARRPYPGGCKGSGAPLFSPKRGVQLRSCTPNSFFKYVAWYNLLLKYRDISIQSFQNLLSFCILCLYNMQYVGFPANENFKQKMRKFSFVFAIFLRKCINEKMRKRFIFAKVP